MLHQDPEDGSRYSLRRLQAFFNVYRVKFREAFNAQSDSNDNLQIQDYARDCLWKRDNQHSYSMYLSSKHNRDIHLDRLTNKGVLTVQYEPADELEGTEVNLRPALYDELDDASFPTISKFLPPDTFREIIEQPAPKESEICVAFPLQHAWQTLEDLVKENKAPLFIANPPVPTVSLDMMTDLQKFAYAQMTDKQQQIVYVSGTAGSGKTTVALLAFHSKELKGRCQAAAGTAKAASNFNGPTIHGMLCWGIDNSQGVAPNKIDQMRIFYEQTDVFIIDEVNAISASTLALLDQRMNEIFEPQKNQSSNKWTRFGAKRMIFLGDPAQLRPIVGSAIYDQTEGSSAQVDLEQKTSPIVLKQKGYKAAKHQYQSNLTAKGKVLYQQYLLPNSIIFKREKRCTGLLQEICDKLRDGTQDKHDLTKLMHLKAAVPRCRVRQWYPL